MCYYYQIEKEIMLDIDAWCYTKHGDGAVYTAYLYDLDGVEMDYVAGYTDYDDTVAAAKELLQGRMLVESARPKACILPWGHPVSVLSRQLARDPA